MTNEPCRTIGIEIVDDYCSRQCVYSSGERMNSKIYDNLLGGVMCG
ncbi:MAG: hypothetical protein P8X91_06540 [Candidatus Bathyarchaeota archaeon]|jgi:hypothetical protein